jgi:hypothetical protein
MAMVRCLGDVPRGDHRSVRASVVGLALVTAVAAGCGGGGKPAGSSGMPTDSTSQRLTRSGYVGRADAICSGLRSRLSSLLQLSPATIGSLKAGRLTPSAFAEVAAWSGALLRATRGPFARIGSLSIPPHDTLIRRWRSLVLRTGADTAALHTAALARDESGVTRALAADLRASAVYMQVARRLGFRVCGQTF